MFRVSAAEVLRCADILRWSEFLKEIIVRRPKNGPLPSTVDSLITPGSWMLKS
jgi:hypothetical protein